MDNNEPIIEVARDYDGHFEAVVRKWLKEKAFRGLPFKHKKVVVSSGPWRSYAVSFESDGDTITFDFYSALRCGFGGISGQEVEECIQLL